ncbi:SEC-C domain-containing protein [Streptomyces sp. NBC_00075]|uniref:SEC-C domain-containing protein n=1 Tax=Streptomyces sp. NBC_00093 TaxID=2975649 RepID=A0AAU2A2J8_9ACTN
MAKKRPQTKASRPQLSDGDIPVVGAREPCPCNSGRRYKACHGRAAAHAVTELVHRPFEGLPGEGDWVALRELVPAATVDLTLKSGLPEGVPSVTLATVLPMAWPALRRDDGSVLLGLQNDTSSGDISRDLADTLQRALTAAPGTPVQGRRAPADGPRLQDLLDPEGAFEPVVHTGFEFWVPDAENATADVTASLERANDAAIPTVKLTGVDAAYWCETPDKNHLRWVMPHGEEQLLDALARLHAAGQSSLGEGTRLVGSFRAHGLTVPVWDLPTGVTAEDVEKPAAEFADRLATALAADAPLTPEERRARGGLTNRQVTLS